jgi:hypothetical protein
MCDAVKIWNNTPDKKKKKNIDNSQKASHFPFIAWGSTTEYVYLIEIEN